MSQLVVKNKFPSLLSDFFNTDRIFDMDLFDDSMKWFPGDWKVSRMPSVNITEKDDAYMVELAVPGMEKKDFKVEVVNNMLTISAEKEEKKTEKEGDFTRKEFSYNRFSRSFTLPENIKTDNIEAEYKDGILKIGIPKKEVTISKKIEKAIPVK